MITEDYVSFETAKLLKEKGFDGECRDYYNTDGHFYSEDFSSNWNDPRNRVLQYASAPTLQMAMKWLRENGYQIIVKHTDDNGYFANILTMDNAHPVNKLFDGYNLYEQAAEAAVKYCLENLIWFSY